MRKTIIILLAVSAALFTLAGCATKADDSYTITLTGNATTGYQWNCEIKNSGIVELVSDSYTVNSHAEGIVGVGGHWDFVFKPVSDGKTTVTFDYSRSWEKDPIEVKTFEFVVKNGIITVVEGE